MRGGAGMIAECAPREQPRPAAEQPPARHPLAAVLAAVDALLARAVEAAQAELGGPASADPFRGLYVTASDARRLVQRASEPAARGLAGVRPVVDVDVAGPAWRRLAEAFELSPSEVDAVALALAPEVDLRYERIVGYLHDDLTKRRPTVDLVMQLLCDGFDERLAARRQFEAGAPLVRYGIVELVGDAAQPHAPAIAGALKLDDGIVAYLLGRPGLDARLGDAAAFDTHARPADLAPAHAALPERLAADSDASSTHVVFVGPDERTKLHVARAVAALAGRPLLVVDLERLTRLDVPFGRAVFLAAREARLHGALLFCRRADVLRAGAQPDAPPMLDSLLRALDAAGAGRAFLCCTERISPRRGDDPGRLMPVHFPLPDAAARQEIWDRSLGRVRATLPGPDVRLLAEVFRFDGETIDRAVGEAAAAARWRDPERPAVTRADVFAGAHGQTNRILPRYATRIETTQSWNDLVLPADQLTQLRELCDRVGHRHTVLTRWGFERRLPLGRGVAALFAGPSGSGKTMAAQIIAAALGLELYRVDIPGVVSKYIGETEKILDQLFREAQGASAVLFFDEADALFGKRSEVRDAHDRYANIEISYLLQALEQYEGLTLLATNLRHNLDDAFVRRLAFVVTFPMPEEPERRKIWERSWPQDTPVSADVDVGFLARQFKLAGGNIRNAALAAAFSAAADGGCVTMGHVIRGVRREYQKMGKVCAESEFGAYFELLAAAGEAG